MRKLGPEERFFGPIGLTRRHGREPRFLLYGVAAALASRIPGDAQSAAIERSLASEGVRGALRLCGSVVPEPLAGAIEALLPELRERFRPSSGRTR
jgi:hypothetical protein